MHTYEFSCSHHDRSLFIIHQTGVSADSAKR